MGGILLTQTISVSLITGIYFLNFWFSYILFIIIVGGILVLFLYITRVARNEKFKLLKLYYVPLWLFFTTLATNAFTDDFIIIIINNQIKFWKIELRTLNFHFLSKYIYFPNRLFIALLIIYLFLTLILVVKLTDLYLGPLRQKF